jgi:hypothetical protein
MVRRDGAEVRKDRILEVTKTVVSLLHNQKEIPLLKTVAALQYETGLTREKIMEYLTIAEAVGRFEIDVEGDRITKTVETPEDAASGEA